MRFLLLAAILYAAAVLETSLGDVIQVGHVTPDLLAMIAVIWVLLVAGPRAFLAAGAIGLVADLIAPGRVGPAVVCFMLVGYAVNRLRTKLPPDQLLGQVATVWAAVTVLTVSLAVGRWLLGETPVGLGTLLGRAAGVGVYTAGVSLPVLMIVGWVREPFRVRRKRLTEF